MTGRVGSASASQSITAIAAVWRLGYLFAVKLDDALLLNDSLYYSIQAGRNSEGDWFREALTEQPGAEHGPLTSLYLTPWSLGPGDNVAWQRFATTLLGIATVAVIGLVGRRLAGPRVGLVAAGIAAVYPNLWINDSLVMSESLACLIVAVALLVALDFDRRPGARPGDRLGCPRRPRRADAQRDRPVRARLRRAGVVAGRRLPAAGGAAHRPRRHGGAHGRAVDAVQRGPLRAPGPAVDERRHDAARGQLRHHLLRRHRRVGHPLPRAGADRRVGRRVGALGRATRPRPRLRRRPRRPVARRRRRSTRADPRRLRPGVAGRPGPRRGEGRVGRVAGRGRVVAAGGAGRRRVDRPRAAGRWCAGTVTRSLVAGRPVGRRAGHDGAVLRRPPHQGARGAGRRRPRRRRAWSRRGSGGGRRVEVRTGAPARRCRRRDRRGRWPAPRSADGGTPVPRPRPARRRRRGGTGRRRRRSRCACGAR